MASQSTIGIIGAMDVEVALLKKQMQECCEVHTTAFSGMEFIEGVIGQTSVVVVKCGVGMVNAATCTQILIDCFGVEAVLNTGIAGSLDATIEIGDVVVATDAVNHIMDVSNLGYAVGQTPGADTLAFPMDEKLSCAVADAAAKIGVTTHRGRVASGDHFVCSDSEKQRITKAFDAKCCEMEGAAIANVCHLANTPCAIVRAISDKADGSSSVDYPTFEAQAAHHCAELVIHAISSLA